MAKREIAGCRVVVTGASSGIGREIALELVRRGAKVVVTARREEKLRELAAEAGDGKAVEIVAGDITDPAVRAAVLERAAAAFGGLDALVNNAGLGAFGSFADADEARLRRIMEVNFFAAAEMTRSALPLLCEGRKPIVVNIGSILGHRALPRNCEYCASKFALRGLSESLRSEFAKLGIDLLLVSPGTTETEFFDSVIEGRDSVPWPRLRGVPAAKVARATVRAMRRGKREIVPNLTGRVLLWVNSLAPGLIDRLARRWA